MRIVRKSIVVGMVFVFLLTNLVVRFATIIYYQPYTLLVAGLLGVVAGAGILVWIFPKLLRLYLLIFGFSFFLFGVGSIDIQSRIFEMLVTLVALTLFLLKRREEIKAENPLQKRPLNPHLKMLLACFSVLAFFSLMRFPVRQILMDLWLFGFPLNFFYLFIGPSYEIYYPVAAVLRLLLFIVMAGELAMSMKALENFKWLFSGMVASGIFSAIIGLLEFYGLISLDFLRFGTRMSTPGVLHALFVNRAWFGEFVLVTIPFILIGFMNQNRKKWFTALIFLCLIVCEIALVMAGGRAGWVSYPLILFFCWLFVYFSKDKSLGGVQFKLKDLVKVAVSVPVTIVISFMLIFYVLMPLSEYFASKDHSAGSQTTDQTSNSQTADKTRQYISQRAANILESKGRREVWTQGFDVGREKKFFGMGFMSFCWHANMLSMIPDSIYEKNKTNKHPRVHPTPHSLYLQLFSGSGIIGLLIWLLISGYAIAVLISDLVMNRRLLNIPVIICTISFHIYGIFQSMQTVPMIWLIIFLCIGYAMILDDAVLTNRLRQFFVMCCKCCILATVVGFGVYVAGFESRDLAEKYDLRLYTRDQMRTAGIHPYSKRWHYNHYRWTGRKGRIYLPADIGKAALELYCITPDAEDDPVEVVLTCNGQVLDTIMFNGEKKTIKKSYRLGPEKTGIKLEENIIEITVSRTWVPHSHLNNFDRRELGVGVKLFDTKQIQKLEIR